MPITRVHPEIPIRVTLTHAEQFTLYERAYELLTMAVDESLANDERDGAMDDYLRCAVTLAQHGVRIN